MKISKIKLLAAEKKVAFNKIANEIGVTVQGLQKMINNESIKAVTLEKIANILGVPVSYFFTDEPLPDNKEISQGGTGCVNHVVKDNNFFASEKEKNMQAQIDALRSEIEMLRKIIDDKNGTIQVLQDIIPVYGKKKK